MASYYEHNYDAFGQECLRAPFMRSAMRARAAAVMATAQSISEAFVDTGEYISSFEVSDGITAYGGKGTRAYGRVTNTAPYALALEFGHGKAPRYRVLGRALFAAGGGATVDIKDNARKAKKSVGK